MAYRIDSTSFSSACVSLGGSEGSEKPKKSPTICEVTLDYLGTVSGAKNLVIKPVSTIFSGMKLVAPAWRPAGEIDKLTKDTKNMLGIAEVPKKVVALNSEGLKFLKSPSLGTLGSVLNKACDLFSPVSDAVQMLAAKIAPLGEKTLGMLRTWGNSTTLFSCSYSFNKLWAERDAIYYDRIIKSGDQTGLFSEQMYNKNLMMIMHASLITLASLSLAATYIGVAAPAGVMWILGTVSLAAGVGGHYHQKLTLDSLTVPGAHDCCG